MQDKCPICVRNLLCQDTGKNLLAAGRYTCSAIDPCEYWRACPGATSADIRRFTLCVLEDLSVVVPFLSCFVMSHEA